VPKPADRLRSQVRRRINHRIERPTIERQLGTSANLRAASLIRGPRIGHTLGISRYGPEQLDFLRYRPVLLNTALKTRFGYTPRKTSAEALEALITSRSPTHKPLRAEH
jgi:UDP-glucose 4-epimerase